MDRPIVFDRPLTDDDRDLLAHILKFGSDGYPIEKVGHYWTWTWKSIQAPKLFATKREAVQTFECYLDVLHDCQRAEAERALFEGAPTERELQKEFDTEEEVCLRCGCRPELGEEHLRGCASKFELDDEDEVDEQASVDAGYENAFHGNEEARDAYYGDRGILP